MTYVLSVPQAQHATVTKRVLIVDDDQTVREVLIKFFQAFEHGYGYDLETAADGTCAISALRHGAFDLVMLDMSMPHVSGLDVLTQMRQDGIRVPVLMLTGNRDSRAAAEALKSGVFAYVPKPVALLHLDHLVALALSATPPAADGRADPPGHAEKAEEPVVAAANVVASKTRLHEAISSELKRCF